MSEKPYTVEAGTFDDESSIDEAFQNPVTFLYDGFF